MIWYFLYPFRGTTEPPDLSDNHPIPRAFYRHGTTAARNWLLFLILSVLISVTVCYSILFTTSASTLPGHGWVSARPYAGNQSTTAHVAVRRIWVHGSYMGALERHVLQDALRIQHAIIHDYSPTSHAANDESVDSQISDTTCHYDLKSHSSWGFHSPLMYWDCSSMAITNDKDLLQTVHEQSARPSYLNLTLLPTSVFSGKTFLGSKLIAADALVITLFDKIPASGATRWDARLVKLAAESSGRWVFYPESGVITTSQLYQYEREMISTRDLLLLVSAYGLMFSFLAYRLQETRAVKSRVGLVAAVITEITISVLASFSICGVLGIDLSRIPREMYPFVVVVIGLENMFRLMNAVLQQPPQIDPTNRIAKALQDVGHLSLAAAAQNLGLLWLMSKAVSPGVQAFCRFAGVALLFDFFFHLIFFVAVLSVDVRRMELQDSIHRAEIKTDGRKRSRRRYWLSAFVYGHLPLSTRVAGSAISICFTLAMNMHFPDADSLGQVAIRALLHPFGQHESGNSNNMNTGAQLAINQARTPQSWLKLQDHQFAQEVIQAINPGAQSLIARVYDPIIVVLSGSDRGRIASPLRVFYSSWEAFNEHILPFLFFIAIFIGLITVLMDYLLWDNRAERHKLPSAHEQNNSLYFKRPPTVHTLDILKLSASDKGHMIATGLDRTTTLYFLNIRDQSYSTEIFRIPTDNSTPSVVVNIAIEENGQWAALCNADGLVTFWSHSKASPSGTLQLDPSTKKAHVFSLIQADHFSKSTLMFVVVLPSGTVMVYDVHTLENLRNFQLHPGPILSASIAQAKDGLHIIAVTNHGEVVTSPIFSSYPSVQFLTHYDRRLGSDDHDNCVAFTDFQQTLNIIITLRPCAIDLVDFSTRLLVHSFPLADQILPNTFRLMHSLVRECRTCKSPAVHSLSFSYHDVMTKECVLKTFTATNDDSSLICLRPITNSESALCRGLTAIGETTRRIVDPGSWEVTESQCIVGIRQQSPIASNSSISKPWHSASLFAGISTASSVSRTSDTAPAQPSPRGTIAMSSRSRNASSTPSTTVNSTSKPWEAWAISPTSDFSSTLLPLQPDDLLVTSPGPLARLGARSVAVAFGNTIRIVTVGGERIEESTQTVSMGRSTPETGKPKSKDSKRRKGAGPLVFVNPEFVELVDD